MAKMHQLKPKPDPVDQGGGGGPSTPAKDNRAMQFTLSQHTHVLLMRLGALWIERGVRASQASKSAVIEAAVAALAKHEGLL